MKLLFGVAIFAAAGAALAGCSSGGDSVNVNQKRDKEVDVSEMIEEFDTEEAMIGRDARIALADGRMYITDHNSTDQLVAVYTLPEGEYLGRFADYGPGPYEIGIAHSVSLFTGADGRRKGLMLDYAQMNVLKYDIDSALTTEKYRPERMKSMDSKVLPEDYTYVNDTVGFSLKITMTQSGMGWTQEIARYNLLTGELTDFAPEERVSRNLPHYDVDVEKNILVEADGRLDRIIIYDLEGKVKKRIKGPSYNDEVKDRKAYFSDVHITERYILAIFVGTESSEGTLGKKIVVMDHDGNYIATLDTGDNRIRNIAYDESSGKLYISFVDGEIQIGMLDLEEAIAGRKGAGDAARKTSARSEKDYDRSQPCPVKFIRLPNLAVVNSLHVDTIYVYEGYEVTCPPEMKVKPSYKWIPGLPETLTIESISGTPEFVDLIFEPKKLTDSTIATGEVSFKEDAPEGKFEGEVRIKFKEFDQPAVLPLSGTIVHAKLGSGN